MGQAHAGWNMSAENQVSAWRVEESLPQEPANLSVVIWLAWIQQDVQLVYDEDNILLVLQVLLQNFLPAENSLSLITVLGLVFKQRNSDGPQHRFQAAFVLELPD